MALVDDVITQCKQVELIILLMVENIREAGSFANPHELRQLIPSAPASDLRERCERLVGLGALDKTDNSYRLTYLGVEVLEREVEYFRPGVKETGRRDMEVARGITLARR